LDPSNTQVSLFSPLDKSIAIVQQKSNRDKGYILFFLNCQSLQSSTQWYAFIHHILNGPPQPKIFLVTVPDLNNLQIQVNTYREGNATVDEQGFALINGNLISSKEIMDRCMMELRKVIEFKDVLDYWEKNFGMGLCWKRYDRIEWLDGNLSLDHDELAGSISLNQVYHPLSQLIVESQSRTSSKNTLSN
jgi:hypothetical protein